MQVFVLVPKLPLANKPAQPHRGGGGVDEQDVGGGVHGGSIRGGSWLGAFYPKYANSRAIERKAHSNESIALPTMLHCVHQIKKNLARQKGWYPAIGGSAH